MKITASHRPKSVHIARLAVHFALRSDILLDERCACACNNLIITVCKKVLSNQNGYKCSKRKRALGPSSSGTSKTRQSKKQVSNETFHKGQWTYEREHQSMTMACRLCAEMDDQGKSLVSTLWCVVCRQYETRLCGPKNFYRA